MRHETSVPDVKHEGRDAILYARQQAAHRRSIADPQVADAVVVDVVAGVEQVDGAPEVGDQLDLFGAVAPGEREEAFGSNPRCVDGNDDGSESREVLRDLQHGKPVTGEPVLHDQARERAMAAWDDHQGRHATAHRARVRKADHSQVPVLPGVRRPNRQRRVVVVREQSVPTLTPTLVAGGDDEQKQYDDSAEECASQERALGTSDPPNDAHR